MNCPQCQALWFKIIDDKIIEIKTRNHNLIIIKHPYNLKIECKCGLESHLSQEKLMVE